MLAVTPIMAAVGATTISRVPTNITRMETSMPAFLPALSA